MTARYPSSAHVVILYNEPVLPADHRDADSEHEVLYTMEEVEKVLIPEGYRVSRLGVQRDPIVLLEGLRRLRPDVVFNLFEGLADQNETEAHVAGMLDWLRVPYTGSPYQTLCMARTKHIAKQLLRGAGLPTADFLLVENLPVPLNTLGWPVMVKPATQDASVGLDQGSVVTDQAALEARVVYLLQEYGGPVMVEEFIRGREINIGLIEAPDLRVLPPSEILFTSKDPERWPIVTYDAKWNPGTTDYEDTPPLYPAEVTPRLHARLVDLSTKAFHLLGCRDYARVDFRVRAGRPFILEINPNPDLSPLAGLCGGLQSAGLTHGAFTLELIRRALARGNAGESVTTPLASPVAVG